jgi:molybdenum cofactor cytidylyltransferase
MNENVIIILAAGASSRMEHPKQLLPFGNEFLLTHTIKEAQKSTLPVIVVLGANANEIKQKIKNLEVEIVINDNWEKGLSSSINEGLKKAIDNFSELKNCILAVCDQPFISSLLFNELLDEKERSGKNIVASAYAHTLGTPSLFDKKYLPELLHLEGDHGAKTLLKKYSSDVASVKFEKGRFDVDTQKDYEEFLKHQNQ